MLIGRPMFDQTTTYSLWSECPGENVTFTAKVIAVGGDAALKVTLQTKAADEADSAAVAATNGTMSNLGSVAVTSQRATGTKQLYRYKLEVTAPGGGSDEKFVHFLMLDPIWEAGRS
jgi:hypothetical protein